VLVFLDGGVGVLAFRGGSVRVPAFSSGRPGVPAFLGGSASGGGGGRARPVSGGECVAAGAGEEA